MPGGMGAPWDPGGPGSQHWSRTHHSEARPGRCRGHSWRPDPQAGMAQRKPVCRAER